MKYIIAFLITFITTPVMIIAAKKFKIVDNPDDFLKPHKKVTPYLGGLALYIGIFIFFYRDYKFIIPATILMFLGLYDDIKNVKPILRLVTEAFTITLSVILFSETGIAESFFLVFYGIGLINAVNFTDGMDGLCSGVTLISLLSFYILSNQINIFIIILTLVAFLVYNFHPAKIFLGDAGSYLLGYIIFYYTLVLYGQYSFKGFIYAFIIAGFFITDMLYAVIRRIHAGKSPFSGDRDHIYDKAMKLYKNTYKAVFISYLIEITFAVTAVIAFSNIYAGIFIYIVLVLFYGIRYRLYRY
ncbi:MAG: undecaprenyl/decaprenyl-phosphate alpha-N-acetylglucosaminyl 1-phosphate transferase [Thermotogae bacterium]|nr:undecaprenyl/decaprenyl-phosphate alpha-N-acetylglucosaminyl 1-phosphate transferase [Thermotogota bacterium]